MTWNDMLNIMLFGASSTTPGVINGLGADWGVQSNKRKWAHAGVDIVLMDENGKRSSENDNHPAINTPIAGEVILAGGAYGAVVIRDENGNQHRFLHLNESLVSVGDKVTVGDQIGTMGGRGPEGPNEFPVHLHYEMFDAEGHALNPTGRWGGNGGDDDDGGWGCHELPEQPPVPTPPKPIDYVCPIVLDLNGNGQVDTVNISDGVYFDHDGNRFAEKSGWVGGGDAILVHDRNKNGKIDDGSELFGNKSILSNGQLAANGFEALKEFDSNGDGIVDRNDARWSELQLWVDRNGNGVVDDGELISMEDAGVSGLYVNYTSKNETDANGNKHLQQGSFIRDDGTVGKMDDVWFETNLADTIFMDKIEVGSELCQLLNIRGYGNIPDLHQVMAMDPGGRLQTLVEQFTNTSDPSTARRMVWDIIFAWTGVSDVAPGSRGQYVDARKLSAMEKLWGIDWVSTTIRNNGYGNRTASHSPNPHERDAANLNKAFDSWGSLVTAYFMLSTHYIDLYNLGLDYVSAIEIGFDPKDSIAPLMYALRNIYSDGNNANATKQVISFLEMLKISYNEASSIIGKGIENYYKDTPSGGGDAFADLINSFYKDLMIFNGDSGYNLQWIKKNALVYGGEGSNHIYGGEGNNIIYGGYGNDIIYGGKGNDIIYGGDGDDTIYGKGGNNILDGGAGNDNLYGGSGNDIFIFGKGYGHDYIHATAGKAGKRDVVRLVGLTANDVEFLSDYVSTQYSNLIIRIKETGETITINKAIYFKNEFNYYSIEAFEFGDGTVMEWADFVKSGLLKIESKKDNKDNNVLRASKVGTTIYGGDGDDIIYGGTGDDILYGGAGNDILYGTYGTNILDGGAGDDILHGGNGNDTFVFGKGYGHDYVEITGGREGKRDVVRLVGLTVDDVEFLSRDAKSQYNRHQHLVIRIKETGETLTINSAIYFKARIPTPYSIEAFEFGDGTVMEWDEFAASGLLKMESEKNNSTLEATIWISTTMYGSDGNDKLYGGRGNDVLIGGKGNDYLEGGAGDNTYIFYAGDGQDTINSCGGGNDQLKFIDINPADLWFNKSGSNLVINLVGSTDRVTIQNWYYGNYYTVDTIKAGGWSLADSQVPQMIQAMASIGAPGGVNGQWTDEQKEAMTPILSTYWKTAA